MSMLAQQQYQMNQVMTASPAELTLMLYKGSVRFINASKYALQKGNYEEASQYNLRAQAIIRELMITLNMDYEISKNLYALYDFLLYRLIQANIKRDIAILDEVRGFCEEFVETWSQAMKLAKR